jgi:IS5 family transposase
VVGDTRLKAHSGVDAESGLVHSVVGTAANVADVSMWWRTISARCGGTLLNHEDGYHWILSESWKLGVAKVRR